ncbi:hypothetical protein BDV93DRAFT_188029 [Ceratobasidium sp. AG-I]|nr:hypothetical protein BDV93DRAFT_188029 [Ceratobasidium sp. AG-I]
MTRVRGLSSSGALGTENGAMESNPRFFCRPAPPRMTRTSEKGNFTSRGGRALDGAKQRALRVSGGRPPASYIYCGHQLGTHIHRIMSYSYAPAAPVLHRGAACLECRRRKLKCDGVRPVCGCCERGRRPGQCDYDPPEGRAFRLQQRIHELEQTIHAIESQSRRRARNSVAPGSGSSAGPSAAPSRAVNRPTGLPSSSADYAQPQIIAPNQLPASVDWFAPGMELASPGLHASYNAYVHPTTASPLRQGRSGEEWLFNDPVQSMAGPVNNDPFTTIAHLAHMPVSTPVDPVSVSVLSSPMHDYLIASFMARRREYGLQVDEERFLTSFALPPDHPSAVHPALRNAVYLLACRSLTHQTPGLAQYEPAFVDKVRQGIADALESAHRDNSHLFSGVILASTLLARYLLIMGRVREAYHQTASVARFAVSCGLHQLTHNLPPHSPTTRSPPILPPPADYTALWERIHAFWAIFTLDRTVGAVTGLPSAFGDDGGEGVDARERITTVWPRAVGEYSHELGHSTRPGFADYFSGGSPRGSPTSTLEPSVCTLVVQALETHYRACEVLHRAGSGTSTRSSSLVRASARLVRAVPALDRFDPDDAVPTPSHSPANTMNNTFSPGSPPPSARVNPALVLVLVLAYGAQMKLALGQLGRGAYGDGETREGVRALVGVMKVARRAGVVGGLDPMVGVRVICPFRSVCPCCSFDGVCAIRLLEGVRATRVASRFAIFCYIRSVVRFTIPISSSMPVHHPHPLLVLGHPLAPSPLYPLSGSRSPS